MTMTSRPQRASAPSSGTIGVGSPLAVPPAWLPLSWLATAMIGLIGFGGALLCSAHTVVATPQAPSALATVHLCMLAFLSTAVLGAAHQFGPVVAGRRLRSTTIGLFTLLFWAPASWLLPYAFTTHRPVLLESAGVLACVAVIAALWNLSGPLLQRGRGTPVVGLRIAVLYFAVTAGFGATYAFDLHHGYFLLLPRRVLAHAHLGLLGWLGLAYVSVAEKLWPMFLLAHRPSAQAGSWSVRLLASGVPLLASGLLIPSAPLIWCGALLAVAGLGAHLISLAQVIVHRRRKMELLHGFVLSSAVMLIVAMWAGLIAGALGQTFTQRTRSLQVEVFALAMWIAIAIVGHLHKIVPFITWSRLRTAGHTKAPTGKPLLFAHLTNTVASRSALATMLTAALCGLGGFATGTPILVAIAGAAFALTGIIVLANLTYGPLAIVVHDRTALGTPAPQSLDQQKPAVPIVG